MKEYQKTKIAEQVFQHIDGAALPSVLKDIEKQVIQIAMNSCKGYGSRAARVLGISRELLVYKRKIYGLAMDLENYYPKKGKLA